MDNRVLKQAIALYKAGNKGEARNRLALLLNTQPKNENAWKWMAVCVDSDNEKAFCLKKALEINPQNQTAKKSLTKLRGVIESLPKELTELLPVIKYGGSDTFVQALSTDKHVAEAVLKQMCLGAQIRGIRFGATLQMLITNSDPYNYRDVYLNLESLWTVFESYPSKLPDSEDDLPEISQEDEIQAICRIRERAITNIELMIDYPHLIITLDDGKVIFINGQDDLYESWSLGYASNNASETWFVVAGPGNRIAVWAPKDFNFT